MPKSEHRKVFFFSFKEEMRMGFRVVMLETEQQMQIKLDNLVINRLEGDIWIPLSDISMLIIDNLMTKLTTRLLCALAEYNIGVVICDASHHPKGYYGAYDIHSRISKNIGYQIKMSQQDYDWLWQNIIETKIQNQMQVLQMYDKDQNVIEKMQQLCQALEVGDPYNREGMAAKIYFEALMGEGFTRSNENLLMNSGLDYGYAIIRSYLAKLTVGYGLNTQLGIHHRNEYNRFNLVDDLMEPFRPILDAYAYILFHQEQFFTQSHRRNLVNFLNHKIKYRGQTMYLCNVMEEYVEQVAAYITGRRTNIVFPETALYMGLEDEI